MTYRPDEIVIGYYDAYIDYVKVRGGFPSCKWLKENNYTEVSAFFHLTHGIKPHMQRDSEKQISKDLGITIGVFKNDFIDGFKIASVSPNVIVKDPRGFYLQLDHRWLDSAFKKHDCSISSDKTISGRLAYMFSNKYFNSLIHENDIKDIDIDDAAIDEANSKIVHFKRKDLEIGSVYDAYEKGKLKTDVRRYVYIGEHEMHNLNIGKMNIA